MQVDKIQWENNYSIAVNSEDWNHLTRLFIYLFIHSLFIYLFFSEAACSLSFYTRYSGMQLFTQLGCFWF